MTSNKSIVIGLIGLVSAMLMGCDGASNDSLEKGVAKYLDARDRCITVVKSLPFETPATSVGMVSRMDALVDAGLLTKKPATSGNVVVYEASSTGETALVDKSAGKSLCFGSVAVKIIESKDDADGIKFVKYSFTIAKLPDWANNPSMQKAYPAIAEKANGRAITETQMMHKKDGEWVVMGSASSDTKSGASSGSSEFYGKPKAMRSM